MEEEQAVLESEQDDTNYYLSSAKPPSINLKWASRDIKEQDTSNNPIINKLDEIGTPFRLFENVFDDTLIEEIVEFSNIYGQREDGDTDFLLTSQAKKLKESYGDLHFCDYVTSDKWVNFRPATVLGECIE